MTQSTLEPGQRGGAGGMASTSTITAGLARAPGQVSRLTFAIRRVQSAKAMAKRAAAAVEHLEGTPGAVVVEEHADGQRLWLIVNVCPPLQPGQAERLAEGCPDYAKGTVEPLGRC